MEIEQALGLLNDHPDYRVVTRIPARRFKFADPDGRNLAKGIIVDTETTGADQERDAIVELGMIVFEYDPETGEAFRNLETFDELEDPGFPIPAEATAVHGISDDIVKGKRVDDAKVESMLSGVSIVIAHNAKFDRGFLEKRLSVFENVPWGCSFAQIAWDKEGLGSAKLDYIAYQYGFFYEAHRAEQDCFALLEFLQQRLPKTGTIVLKSILDGLSQKCYKLFALGSAFDKKDLLKQLGYRWDANRRLWHFTATGDEPLKSEVEWLKDPIYDGRPALVEIEVLNCLTRFSNRPGKVAVKNI